MRQCWRSRYKPISDILLWTPSHGRGKAGRPARNYIQQLCADTGYSLKSCWKQWTIGRGGEKGSGRSLLIVRYDEFCYTPHMAKRKANGALNTQLALRFVFLWSLEILYLLAFEVNVFRGTRGIMVIVLGNELSDLSSNPGRSCLHF